MRTILIILVCTLVPMGVFAGSYSSADLQKDFQQAYELTRSIYTESAQAGEVMSRTFAPQGRAQVTHSVDTLVQVEQQLKPKTETKTKTRQLQEVNQRIFYNLAQPTPEGESLRTELAGLLMERRHREYRWGLLGVVELLGTRTDIRDTSSVRVLKALSPDLYDEAGEAVKNISFGFVQLPAENPGANESISEYLEKHPPSEWAVPGAGIRPIYRPEELEQIINKPITKREGGRSGGGQPDPGYGFDWDGMKELGSNIMNSVLDNLYDDYQQGAEWGATAGQIIGAASGMQDAVNTVAQGATAMDLAEAAGGAAVDQVIPDPYEIVGYYAGGVIGMIGGAVGTTAGWIVGTVEGHLAQHKSSGGRQSAGGREGGSGGGITLF